jgi:hypothetical protein
MLFMGHLTTLCIIDGSPNSQAHTENFRSTREEDAKG